MKVHFNQVALLGEGIVYRTESESRAGVSHYTVKLRNGGIICSCEGWQFRGTCKHAVDLPLDSAEAQEIQRRWHAHPNQAKSG